MARFLANLVIVCLGVVVVFALFPTATTTRYAARVANRIVGWILDGTYRAVDAVAGYRERQTRSPADTRSTGGESE